MRPNDCLKWEPCNAPDCPFDPDRLKCRHLKGEAVCLWLRERAKHGGKASIATALPSMQAEAVEVAYRQLSAASTVLAGELEKALRYGSKLTAAQALRSPSLAGGAP